MKKNCYLLLLLFFFIFSLSESYSQYYNPSGMITIQGGGGVSYGGFGAKVTANWGSVIGISGGIGVSNGTPLSYGSIDDIGKISRNNTSGLGFALGLDLWYTCNLYTSFQFIGTGSYKSDEYDKMLLYGVNWTVFGGKVHLGNSPLFFDFAGNIAFLFPTDKNDNTYIGGVFGLSIGLGYTFVY